MDEAELRQRLNGLIAQREALELEAEAITTELTSPGPNGEPPAGIKAPIVDADGFPRGDIDVMRVRAQRNRLACIQTDYKALMKEIQDIVHALHALAMTRGSSPEAESKVSLVAPPTQQSKPADEGIAESKEDLEVEETNVASSYEDAQPYAVIDEVFSGSPAAECGLQPGDCLLQFENVTKENNDGLRAIVSVVRHHINEPILIVVRRGEFTHKLSLTPRVWAGQGLIGCHLMPL